MTTANLYPRLTSFASLQVAARRAQRGKRYRPAVLAFNANLEAELLRLQEELRSFIYSPALDAFPGDSLLTPLERPRGLPIGNLTSQFLANLHLNALDHTLSALPGVRAYLRYVDDLALFADYPEPLQRARCRLEAELAALRLRAHPVKTQIRRCRDGASFVGFVVRPGRLRVRNHNLRRGCRRLKLQHKAVLAGALPAAVARTSLLSWNAHLAHGHTWRLRRRLFFSLPYATDLP
jgi:RNA-directed DNA polymerase